MSHHHCQSSRKPMFLNPGQSCLALVFILLPLYQPRLVFGLVYLHWLFVMWLVHLLCSLDRLLLLADVGFRLIPKFFLFLPNPVRCIFYFLAFEFLVLFVMVCMGGLALNYFISFIYWDYSPPHTWLMSYLIVIFGGSIVICPVWFLNLLFFFIFEIDFWFPISLLGKLWKRLCKII